MDPETLKRITPDDVDFMHVERCESIPEYRIHICKHGTWYLGYTTHDRVSRFPDVVRDRISECMVTCRRSDEFPRRCAAQRDVLIGILEAAGTEWQDEFLRRLGADPDCVVHKLRPHEQPSSVEILRDMVKEVIQGQRREIKSEREANRVSRDLREKKSALEEAVATSWGNPAKEPLRIMIQDLDGNLTPAVGDRRCECGSAKIGLPHSKWCPAHGK